MKPDLDDGHTRRRVALVTIWLGWWRLVFTEENRLGGWFRVIPFVYALVVLIGIPYLQLPALGTTVIVLLVVGWLLVAFVEEVVFRGILVVGLHGGVSEPRVCFLSALVFGLSHLTNVFGGMDMRTALITAAVAFMAGVVYYVVRRTTGTLWVTILLHAGFDFTRSVTLGGYDLDFTPFLEPLLFLAILVTIRWVFRPANTGTPRVT